MALQENIVCNKIVYIVFRTDASLQIGTGHVMRCLTLADELKETGAQCRFICREHSGNLIELIRQRGFFVSVLPLPVEGFMSAEEHVETYTNYSAWLGATLDADAEQSKFEIGETTVDWLIVDHYALNARWERMLRPLCRQLMVIDDLANREHDCDLLLDQNFYWDQAQRYQGLLPKKCQTLLGPSYVLLRPEFKKARQGLRARDGIVKRIVIFFGGSDPSDQTSIVLSTLVKINIPGVQVDVVVGHTNPNRRKIKLECSKIEFATYHCNVSNMADLIVNADLGIGAGGSAMWERCYLGLPTITIVSAENQLRTTEDVAQLGAIDYLGCSILREVDYECAISSLICNPQRLMQMSAAAFSIFNEQLTTPIINAMQNSLHTWSYK